MYTFNEMLEKAVELKASDLHLTVNQPPTLRINGTLIPICQEKIQPEDTDRFAQIVLQGDTYKKFQELGPRDSLRLKTGGKVVLLNPT
jgi:twitching motility protein PilT